MPRRIFKLRRTALMRTVLWWFSKNPDFRGLDVWQSDVSDRGSLIAHWLQTPHQYIKVPESYKKSDIIIGPLSLDGSKVHTMSVTSSRSSGFSDGTKLATVRLAGPNFCACNTWQPQICHVIALEDTQVCYDLTLLSIKIRLTNFCVVVDGTYLQVFKVNWITSLTVHCLHGLSIPRSCLVSYYLIFSHTHCFRYLWAGSSLTLMTPPATVTTHDGQGCFCLFCRRKYWFLKTCYYIVSR